MIIFSDNYNFKRANFAALFDFLDQQRIGYEFDTHAEELKKSWGKYDSLVSDAYERLESLKIADYFDEMYKGINLFSVYKFELFSSSVLESDWLAGDQQSEQELFELILNTLPHRLADCRSAARIWIDYWSDILRPSTKYSGVIAFGGSLIYCRAMLEVARINLVPGFVVEHFFTGNDFYFEPRYSSLPNNSALKSLVYARSLSSGSPVGDARLFKRLNAALNKNVKQPSFSSYPKNKYALVLTQVPNDFSIMSDRNRWKNSIGFYKEVINQILNDTSDPIVIKVHPYERRKNVDAKIHTGDALAAFRNSLTPDHQARIEIVEDFSLAGLINGCRYAIVLNSQSGLEVVGQGKPLICFGKPFYGGHGFTFDLDRIDGLKDAVRVAHLSGQHLMSYVCFMNSAMIHLIGSRDLHKVGRILGTLGNEGFGKHHLQHATPAGRDLDVLAAKEKKSNSPLPTIRTPKRSGRRLLAKFIRDPKTYCLDSKIGILNFIGRKVL